MRSDIAHSAEAASNVTAFYNDTLGVGPSAADLANCENAFANGQSLAAQQTFLRPNFAQSQTAANAIQGMFQGELGRPATQQDLGYWEGQIQQGDSLGEIKQAFAQSPDAANAIQGLFQGELGRPATQLDIACWEGQLAQGVSLTQIRQVFAQSPDAQTQVQNLYQAVLG